MGFLNAVGTTCVLCTIPCFDPSARLLVCSRGCFTYFYVVAMEFFQPVHGMCDILMRISAMQHPQPEDVYPEFPPQPQSFHPHSRDFRQQDMITDRPVDPRSLQPGDRSMNASAARAPYSTPITMDQRHLANSASALSQRCPHTLALLLGH